MEKGLGEMASRTLAPLKANSLRPKSRERNLPRLLVSFLFWAIARQGLTHSLHYLDATLFTIHSLFFLRRTEGADEKLAEGLSSVIGEVAGSSAGKRI